MKKTVEYVVTTLVGLGIVLLVSLGRGLFDGTDANAAYRILSDGFFTAGALVLGIGILIAISTTGFFDMGGFALRTMKDILLNVGKKDRRHKDYYEYKMAKGDDRKGKWSMVAVGLILLIIAFVFNVMYVPIPLV